MSYIHVETGEYPLAESDIRRRENTSFPADQAAFDACVVAFGYAPVSPRPRPTPVHTWTVIEGDPQPVLGEWVQTWDTKPATEAEIAERTAAQVAAVKAQRNDLLQQCDWTQLPDAPADRQAWATYREQLRQVKAQPGFPWQVAWPQPPEAPSAPIGDEDVPRPEGWAPPQDPRRGQLYEAPDGSLWRWDQPRDEGGQYVADDPVTPEIESALRWIPQ